MFFQIAFGSIISCFKKIRATKTSKANDAAGNDKKLILCNKCFGNYLKHNIGSKVVDTTFKNWRNFFSVKYVVSSHFICYQRILSIFINFFWSYIFFYSSFIFPSYHFTTSQSLISSNLTVLINSMIELSIHCIHLIFLLFTFYLFFTLW